MIAGVSMGGELTGLYPQYYTTPVQGVKKTGRVSPGDTLKETDAVKKSECKTCKSRKYVDGSDEGNVSFKAPGHISPGSSASKVMSHEREHVSNAVSEGTKENKRLVSATVSLQMSVCPECGTSYVSGGTTRTTMATYSDNPYDQNRKVIEGSFLAGQYVDCVA